MQVLPRTCSPQAVCVVLAQVFPRTPGIATQLLKATAVVREKTDQDTVRTVAKFYDMALNSALSKPGRCPPTQRGIKPALCCVILTLAPKCSKRALSSGGF